MENKSNRNEQAQPEDKQSAPERAGVDSRGESEKRYQGISDSGAMRGGRERQYHEKKQGLTPLPESNSEKAGYGSKAEGAFGKDHTGPRDPKNARYRRDEPHGEEVEGEDEP